MSDDEDYYDDDDYFYIDDGPVAEAVRTEHRESQNPGLGRGSPCREPCKLRSNFGRRTISPSTRHTRQC